MDEHEPEEQFEAADYDEKGNIKLPPPPLEAAKPKRPTVAGLKKELDELKADVDDSVLGWLGELDVRLGKLEQVPTQDIADVASDINARLDNQEAAIGALADALRTYGEGIADWGSRMEECEDSITSLQTANADIQESAKHTELVFAQPPQQMAGGQWQKSDIEAVASICEHMTDVLMITRVLKAMSDLPDEDRTYLLTTACRAAGVPLSPGLQIRAGVRNVEA